jgi:hypothetical protein
MTAKKESTRKLRSLRVKRVPSEKAGQVKGGPTMGPWKDSTSALPAVQRIRE